MAKARPVPELRAEQPYAVAAARVVAVRAGEIVEHGDRVLDLDDIERVHDMRVATRRLRAALEVFEPCFPRKRYKRALRQVKELADALGERRDRDVTIAALCEIGAGLTSSDRPGVESLIAQLRSEQEAANEALEPAVASEHLEGLRARLAELAAAAEELVGPEGPPPAALASASSGNGSGVA